MVLLSRVFSTHTDAVGTALLLRMQSEDQRSWSVTGFILAKLVFRKLLKGAAMKASLFADSVSVVLITKQQ